jgi:hypothetical protein
MTETNSRFVVIARGGLKLRSGPSQDFDAVRTLPEGTAVDVISREGVWALVDLEGDGKADGFVNFPFLRPAGNDADAMSGSPSGLDDITGLVTPAMVKQTFLPGQSWQTSLLFCHSFSRVCARAGSATAP